MRKAVLPAAIAGVFYLLNVWLPLSSGSFHVDYERIRRGSYLLAGLANSGITWNMPFFECVSAFFFGLGISLELFLSAIYLSCCALVFCAGYALRGYRGGLLALLLSGILGMTSGLILDEEQLLYSLFLLLTFLLLPRMEERSPKHDFYCGLAIGGSLLVRTPLLFFPPLLGVAGLFVGAQKPARKLLSVIALMAGAYALLLPWGLLNRSISGKFRLTDSERAYSNVVSSAMGSIYTMEGDYRKLAGLSKNDDVFLFYAKQAAKAPAAFLVTVAKRLYHIVLFHPLLFAVLLSSAVLYRGSGKLILFMLPAYFIIVHSLLTIEARYFYPLIWLVPPLAARAFLQRSGPDEAASAAPVKKYAYSALALSMAAILPVELLVLAYPERTEAALGRPARIAEMARLLPGDRVLAELRCRQLLTDGDEQGYSACEGAYANKFGDTVAAYFVATGKSVSPSDITIPQNSEMECGIIRMLREAELGHQSEAAAAMAMAYDEYVAHHSMLRGTPYAKDRELAARLVVSTCDFLADQLREYVLKLPPARMRRTLDGLAPIYAECPPPNLVGLKNTLAMGEIGDILVRRGLAADIFGISPEARASKELSDLAAQKIALGSVKDSEQLLLKSLELEPANPEALMDLCFIRRCRGAGRGACDKDWENCVHEGLKERTRI